jgi:hypothetical protein
MEERGLMEQPLFGGLARGNPRFLWCVPSRVVERLAAIATSALAKEVAEWNARSPSPNGARDLAQLRALAVAAMEEEKEMFIWLVHPTHRGDPVPT